MQTMKMCIILVTICVLVYIICLKTETIQKIRSQTIGFQKPFPNTTIDIHVYKELLTSYEWNSIKSALEDASHITSTTFNINTDFIITNTSLVITPWSEMTQSSIENKNNHKTVFCMCSHAPIENGIHSPSSNDECAHVAAVNAKSQWGAWRPTSILAITHASQPRYVSIAQSFVDNICDHESSPNLEVTECIKDSKKFITQGDGLHALLIMTQPELITALEQRKWFTAHNTKLIFIGELNDNLQKMLDEFSIPYAELHPYHDVFSAYCNAVNIEEIWRRRRQQPAVTEHVAFTPWKKIGTAIVLNDNHISSWDNYDLKNIKTSNTYYTHTGEVDTIPIQEKTTDDTRVGCLNGKFKLFPIYQKQSHQKKFQYIIVMNNHNFPLPLLPQLKTGDFVEIPGTLEHAKIILSENTFIHTNKLQMLK